MVTKTHEEYFVGVLKKFDADKGEKRYYNARAWYPGVNSLTDRYCKTLEEAKQVLAYAYKLWNGVKLYNEKGERYETTEAAPGIGVSLVCTRETDEGQRIVKHIIRKRLVTEWEVVEEG